MTYNDLNSYQRAYQIAIDINNYLEKHKDKHSKEIADNLRSTSRNIITNIAEGYSQKTDNATRFFYFKALDYVHRIMLDLDFMHDTKGLQNVYYSEWYNSYEQVAKMLYKMNQNILEGKPATKNKIVHPLIETNKQLL